MSGGREEVSRKSGRRGRRSVRLLSPAESELANFGTRLSTLVGLPRTGLTPVRIPAGKESFVYHSHHREAEWIYVISGRGVAEIQDEEFEVASGDFMGFPTPSVDHHLRNPYDEDLVYLVGGENLDMEIADFPRLGKRMIRRDQDVEIYDASDARDFGPLKT